MSYSFNPLTDEEIDSISLMSNGVYDFQVMKSSRKVSKNNNPMAELQLMVWDKEGKTHVVFDYLVFSSVPLNIKKVKRFCDSVGLEEQYKQGNIPEELENMCGKVEIGTKDEQPNGNGGFYPKKNMVIDYIKGNSKTEKPDIKQPIDQPFNDDIPF